MNKILKKLLRTTISKTFIMSIALCGTPTLMQGEPAHHEQQAVQLGSSFLQFIDGQPFGITPHIFGYLLQLRLGLKQIFYGNPTAEKIFSYKDKKQTLKEMALLEIKAEKTFKELCAQRARFDQQEWQEIETENAEQGAELRDSLAQAKQTIADFLLPFLRNIQPIKKQIVPLMSESCEKRGHASSLLPVCVNMADETEVTHFKQNITSYKELGLFCLDLIHFLTDMISSCPKARAQFEQLRKTDVVTQSIIDSAAE
ncbi:hypothetical protein CVU75_03825 [Candidatus Dependentiae bacterium HGW-Dependentiae-1]|nr:MAG: hypothetical protein CVU75_03825 [Candidatus Dependentiae bacterium HGW-Dependentiae-1]